MSTKHTLAVTAIIEYQGRIFFIQRLTKDENFSGKWVFPGGKVEAGEDAIQALLREIREETNIELHPEIQLLSSYMFYREEDASSTVGEVFLLRAVSDLYTLDTESYEHAEWILPEDVYNFDTIYGMEVHVRNAIIALRTGKPLQQAYMSVTNYQKNNCSMSAEYLKALQAAPDVYAFLAEHGGHEPHI